ncbi:MAG: hypothetical protein ACI4XL_04445 [Bacillus sp. (in: firmicutes)]
METAIIVLLSLSFFMLIVSFLRRDRITPLQKEVEELSLQHIHDIYLLKQRIRILEEELMISQQEDDRTLQTRGAPLLRESSSPVNEILKSQVTALHKQGYSVEEIMKRSALSKEQVLKIIQVQSRC